MDRYIKMTKIYNAEINIWSNKPINEVIKQLEQILEKSFNQSEINDIFEWNEDN